MHDEYANECFKLYLLHLGRYCGMENRGSLPQARSALREHWANNMDFFRSSNVEKQVRYVKKQLIKARNRIAKEASAKWAPTKWSSEDLAKYALTLHKVNTFGVKGDSHANWVVRRKVELLEQVAILEVCGELGIDLFDDSHEGREWIRYRSAE
ncbi:MAG: hypothetical protein U1E29_01155, partial [Coriobacteriia bacterium]|nr:hypothetical protein [Coriobacteriia bacterium]